MATLSKKTPPNTVTATKASEVNNIVASNKRRSDQGGAGFSYFVKDNLSVNVEYRKRHVSNASIKEPNGGIEANVYLVGMSWYF